MDQSRRNVLKFGSAALALIPVVAMAAKNPGARVGVQYQDSPKDGNDCSSCVQFVPGKSPADMGGCKVIPDDTEVSPKGWCVAWFKKP